MLLPLSAVAQPPIQFVNSAQAVQNYEDSTLESLLQRCTTRSFTDLWDREEVRAVRNGYTLMQQRSGASQPYSIFVFDQDKRSFLLIDGQSLDRNARLVLKLALPRDYSRCRVVRSPNGFEQLEVVHMERNAMSDMQNFQRMMKDLEPLAYGRGPSVSTSLITPPEPVCPPTGKVAPASPIDRLVVQESVLEFPACSASVQNLRQRMDRQIRKVFDR